MSVHLFFDLLLTSASFLRALSHVLALRGL